ncbi:unnamed protein product [Bursaphelenchus xylophilus]|uniref:(pine wood nematode) hypothetical protein n=1 Tax=Bursaphelenchus xylophilus TaxID=6326 RepID=A0A1I7RI60_BURXY|nr:unnamed protein product [Bursaphelenchus xylophilus]CAG9115135.1 unnamed protein product [Bursaphelenchus xylophilus]
MVVTPKKSSPKPAYRTPTKILQERYQRFIEPPKLCTRKEMCMQHPRECQRMRNDARLCRTAPMSFKIGKTRSVMGSNRPKVVSFKETPPPLSDYYSPSKLEQYLDQVFSKIHTVGSGSFGNVYCMKSLEDGGYYAVKCSREPYRSRRHRTEKQREVMFLERLDHSNIIHFYSAWEENDLLYIQTELCEKSLQTYIMDMDGQIPEGTIWNAFVDMLQACKYIHSLDIVHVDIKPDNIFISTKQVFKLGDFGIAVDLKNDSSLDQDHEGDAKYLAKEALNMETVTTKMDMFSLGLSIFQMATDLWVPANGQAWQDVRDLKFSKDILEKCESSLRKILLRMMDPDPEERPEAKEVLKLEEVRGKAKRRIVTTANLSWNDSRMSYSESSFKDRLLTPPSQRLFENSSMYTPVRRPPSLKRCFKILPEQFLPSQVLTESSFG